MRLAALASTAFLALVLADAALSATQGDRDYVFTDDTGHLVLRFANAEPQGLTRNQMDEIVNVQLSTMVHDRLRADALFEAEPMDRRWAEAMETSLRRRLSATLPDISALHVECRSASCRVVLEHSGGQTVAEHQSVMDTVQHGMEAFIAANPGSFERVFMIAAHYKEPGSPYVKVFLRRAASPPSSDERTGG